VISGRILDLIGSLGRSRKGGSKVKIHITLQNNHLIAQKKNERPFL